MKHCLLLLGVVAALAIGAPAAYSQAVGMDVDGDTDCDVDDVITSTTTGVDVYFDTNGLSDEDACTGGASELGMFSYDVIITKGGTGTLDLSSATWTNQLSSFTVLNAVQKSPTAFAVGFTAPLGTTLAEGSYLIGRLNFTATGSPTLAFSETNPMGSSGSPVTGFGTNCSQINGIDMTNANTATLGVDFFDACGTAAGTPTNTTTWGAIKNLYR